jgi:hypothetical protein
MNPVQVIVDPAETAEVRQQGLCRFLAHSRHTLDVVHGVTGQR